MQHCAKHKVMKKKKFIPFFFFSHFPHLSLPEQSVSMRASSPLMNHSSDEKTEKEGS